MSSVLEANSNHDSPIQTLLQALLYLEGRYYSRLIDYSMCNEPDAGGTEATWRPSSVARNKIGQWAIQRMFSVVDHYDFSRHCVSVALNLMDRMIHSAPCKSCLEFQLLSVACVFLAVKLSGTTRILTVTAMAHHVQGRLTTQDIIDMEYRILTTLDWFVHPPTTGDFLYHYWNVLVVHSSKFVATDHRDILDTAMFLVEHTVIDSFFSSQKPSVISMAALSLTIPVQVPVFLDFDKVQHCRHRLSELVAQNIAITEQHQRTHSPLSVVSSRVGGNKASFYQVEDHYTGEHPLTLSFEGIRNPGTDHERCGL